MRLAATMELAKKQRITGAAVLIAAGLLLYPLLFDDAVFRDDEAAQIPPPLPVPEVPAYVAEIDRPLPALPEEPVDDEELAAKDNAVPELGADHIPVSWTLQLAAFVQKENAVALRDRLRKDGYRAYLRTVTLSDGKSVVRVYVGPELVRNKAETLLTELDKGYELEGLVVRYRP
ncbi:SPOR domain-containing protein [Kistimonas scapharcae]